MVEKLACKTERLIFSPFQLPDNVNIAKEARTAIGKAASVFVLYATSWYVLGVCCSINFEITVRSNFH